MNEVRRTHASMTASPRISKAAPLKAVNEAAPIADRGKGVKGLRHAWLTKSCLEKGGIRRIRIEFRPGSSVLCRNADSSSGQWYILGIEVFDDFKAALANARMQRDRRIRYLEGQIKRLHRLEFKE